MTAPLPALSRRTTLGLVAAPLALLLTSCSRESAQAKLDAGVDRLEAPRSTPPAPVNPDQSLVDTAVAAIADLRATLLPHRGDDAAIADLVRLHAAHLKALGAASTPGTPAPLGSEQLSAEVAVRERALSTLLAAKAAAARDGQLARLLASMSAAIVQRSTGTAA